MTTRLDTWQGQSKSPAQTVALGRAIAHHARAGDLIALVGELGAGKTQFVRGLAEGLDVQQASVTSPTFVMVHEYRPADARAADRPKLVHIDAYRLHSLEDIESIGWEITGDTLGGEMRQGAVVVVEWADRLHELLGDDRLDVALSHEGESQRGVNVSAHGSWRERLSALSTQMKTALAPIVTGKCPICNAPTRSDSDMFPFCSDRCRIIDLGKWLKEDYVITQPVEQRDLEEGVD